MRTTLKPVTLTTDGACNPNPGKGGWAAILRYGAIMKEISGSCPWTTNNRMEMQAAIEGLRCLKEPCLVTLRTDSMYVIYAVKRYGTKKKNKSNADLVHELWAAMIGHHIKVEYVRGHAGDPDNERCDELAGCHCGLVGAQESGRPPWGNISTAPNP